MNKRQQAFLKHVATSNESLGRYCFAITGSINEADDLVQEVLLVAWEKFDTIRDKSAFKYYLFTTARQIHSNVRRRKKFSANWDEAEIGELSDGGLSPEMQTEIRLLYKAINQLSPEYRDVILLYEINGFRVKEIAEIQNVSESAVKKRLTRGREKLYKLLRDTESQGNNKPSSVQDYVLNIKTGNDEKKYR